ncbi:brain and acute leukemia cytoplasmic protein, partial [Octodon degus]|uniref:Brain and acute leukemia cytoplasmic protein n=1 Tax=Octodon degus TaxID=10160 RepID=A0A6P3VDS4_OCTDE
LEDGPSPSGAPRASVPSGIANLEKKMNGGTPSLSSGPLAQRQNGLWTTEPKRDTKRMSTKEVTINVPDSLRQMDRSNRITKNFIN